MGEETMHGRYRVIIVVANDAPHLEQVLTFEGRMDEQFTFSCAPHSQMKWIIRADNIVAMYETNLPNCMPVVYVDKRVL